MYVCMYILADSIIVEYHLAPCCVCMHVCMYISTAYTSGEHNNYSFGNSRYVYICVCMYVCMLRRPAHHGICQAAEPNLHTHIFNKYNHTNTQTGYLSGSSTEPIRPEIRVGPPEMGHSRHLTSQFRRNNQSSAVGSSSSSSSSSDNKPAPAPVRRDLSSRKDVGGVCDGQAASRSGLPSLVAHGQINASEVRRDSISAPDSRGKAGTSGEYSGKNLSRMESLKDVKRPYDPEGPAEWSQRFLWLERGGQMVLLTAGHAQGDVVCYAVDGNIVTRTQTANMHRDVVTCMACAGTWDSLRGGNRWVSGGKYLVTGGKDHVVRIWWLGGGTLRGGKLKDWSKSPLPRLPMHVLNVHSSCVTCISTCSDMDLVVSGGADARVSVCKLSKGKYIRALEHVCLVDRVTVTKHGHIVVYGRKENVFTLFDVNGW
jgi:hypothetical protein